MSNFKYKVFNTKNNYYLYDGVSANIFNIDDKLYQNHKYLFSAIEENKLVEANLLDSYSNIRECIECGALKPKSKEYFKYWFDIKGYEDTFKKGIKHLLIGLTEKCNLRCKYCVYGGHYENERTHNDIDISYSDLKQSIDKLFKSSSRENKIVNLYGGEPFINFQGMKDIVEYINSIDSNTSIFITTNGTLLKGEILDWLVDNKNVNIFVSFAGIPSTHDKLRVFVNDKPTYSVIRENLLKLRSMSESTYLNQVNFIFNLFSEYQLMDLQKHWESDELFKGVERKPEITYIDCYDDDGYVRELSKEIIEACNRSIEPLDEYIRLLKNKDYDNLIVKNYDEKLLNAHRRVVNNSDNILSGVCRPLTQKLFIDANGGIHLCENFLCKNRFGNINTISSLSDCFDGVTTLLEDYKDVRMNSCDKCWANKLCRLCFKDTIDNEGRIDNINTLKACKEERNTIVENFIEYCTVLENGEGLLDHLDDYIIYD